MAITRSAQRRRAAIAPALLAVAVVMGGAGAAAQEQDKEPVAERAAIDQIGKSTPDKGAVEQAAHGEDSAPDAIGEQLSDEEAAKEPVPQLSTEKKTAKAGEQLYRGKRDASPSTPLSTPQQGRKQEVVRLKGKDRCDPSQKASADPECKHVIETRSAEFERPDPTTLSPEQRLLIYQRQTEDGRDVSARARRVGQDPVDPNDPDAQNLASLVLPRDQTTEPKKPKEPAEDATKTNAAVLDIIQAITQQTGP